MKDVAMKRIISFSMMILILLSFAGCNTFEDTPETDAAFAAYEAAVLQTIDHKKGSVTVLTENKDTAIENKETVGVIEYSFETDAEEKVTFERNDYTNGEPVAAYKADGEKAYQMDMQSGEWQDVTEDSVALLSHKTNYMNTLSLFRIDNNFKYSKHFLESVKMEEAAGEKVVIFTLKGDKVTDMLEFSDQRKIKREMSSQTRSYYINAEGDIQKIVIDTLQNVKYEGKSGILSSKITVTTQYE